MVKEKEMKSKMNSRMSSLLLDERRQNIPAKYTSK